MTATVLVAIGGALGSVARYWVSILVGHLTGPRFPWGTILINIAGSFAIGFFAAATMVSGGRFVVSNEARLFFMVGVCGGFTTFSSFSLQTLDLVRDGRAAQAFGNIALSIVLCLTAVAAGYYGGQSIGRSGIASETPLKAR